jgi:hypothetical protein
MLGKSFADIQYMGLPSVNYRFNRTRSSNPSNIGRVSNFAGEVNTTELSQKAVAAVTSFGFILADNIGVCYYEPLKLCFINTCYDKSNVIPLDQLLLEIDGVDIVYFSYEFDTAQFLAQMIEFKVPTSLIVERFTKPLNGAMSKQIEKLFAPYRDQEIYHKTYEKIEARHWHMPAKGWYRLV